MTDIPPPPGDTPADPFSSSPPRLPSAPPPPGAAPAPGAPPMPGAPPSYGAPPPPVGQPVPQGYHAYPQGGALYVAPQKSGKLLAGGIVAVVLAAFVILTGLAIALIGNAFNGFGGNIGASIVLLGLIIAAFGGFGLASGIGAIMRRQWGRICSIVFGAVNGVFAVLALVGDGEGGNIVYLAMSIAIVVLCAIGPASPA